MQVELLSIGQPAILLDLHLAEDILDLAPQNWEDDPDGDGDEGSEAQEGDGHLCGEDEDSADNEAENTFTTNNIWIKSHGIITYLIDRVSQ